MNGRLWLFFTLAIKRGELGRLNQGFVRDLLSIGIADHNVTAGIVGSVHPGVARMRDLERQHIIVCRFFTYQDLEAVAG